MNYERIRRAIIDYYGSAMFSGFPMAMMNVSKIKKMTEKELLKEARKIGLDLNKYKI